MLWFYRMNDQRLASLQRKSPVSKLIFEHLAARQRNRKETTVDGLISALQRDGTEVSRNEVVAIFKELQDAECGKFLVGRKGHQSRFEWKVPLSKVGGIAPAFDASPGEEERKPLVETPASTLYHQYILRQDFTVKLSLPADLTDAEASRLADFIRTIPFT